MQPGIGKDGEHRAADDAGVSLVKEGGAPLRRLLPPPGTGDARQVQKVVADAGLLQPLGFPQDVRRLIALVHKGKGLVVPCFHPDGDAVIPQPGQLLQLFAALVGNVGNPGKAPDGFTFREVLPHQLPNAPQPPELQGKGIAAGEEHPLYLGALPQAPEKQFPLSEAPHGRLGLQKVRLHRLQGAHPEGEGQLPVKGAEFTPVMGAAGGDLQQQRPRLVGGPPDGPCVVHTSSLLSAGTFWAAARPSFSFRGKRKRSKKKSDGVPPLSRPARPSALPTQRAKVTAWSLSACSSSPGIPNWQGFLYPAR